MGFTSAGLDLMLNAIKGTNPTVPITHVGAFDASPALTSVTGVTSTDTFTKTSHGMANGTVVVLSALTGGTGLNVQRVYFVIGQTANTFQLSTTSGGSAVDLGTDVTSVTVTPYVEISGGSYARQAIAFNASVDGAMDDSTNGAVIPIPAAATVDAIGLFSASTAGTLDFFTVVTAETFAGAGNYTVNDADLTLAPTM